MIPSSTHLVLIPSYNTGTRLLPTVEEALRRWQPVWVVIDGSTDDSAQSLDALAAREPALRILSRSRNGGKGAAVLTGVEAALDADFTHVLVMDSDGQHPPTHIAPFMTASQRDPAALVLGLPVFGPEAPFERLQGRKLSVGLAHFETFSRAIGDPLFGFRVYPAAAPPAASTSIPRSPCAWSGPACRRSTFPHRVVTCPKATAASPIFTTCATT
jgi:glycosyltransferase involved in cell wall biosynthesis